MSPPTYRSAVPYAVCLRRACYFAVLLGGVVLMVGAVVLPFGWAMSGNRAGFLAGAAAGGVCLLAAAVALTVSEPFRKPQYMLALVNVGMMTAWESPWRRIGGTFRGGPLAEAGFLYYLVVFYPVTLAVETFLACPGPIEEGSHGTGLRRVSHG